VAYGPRQSDGDFPVDEIVDLPDTRRGLLDHATEHGRIGDFAAVGQYVRDLGQGVDEVVKRCPPESVPPP
jgi:hypothetical protein